MGMSEIANWWSRLSLGLNVLVLLPVCLSLFGRAAWCDSAYGPASPARGILLSIYLAILIASIGLLFRPVPAAIIALLAVQVIYKVTTPLTVGTVFNPVVASNLAIALVHSVTIVVLLRPGGFTN
jgi:hypothetical protein